MRRKIIKIGNSMGIIIPSNFLEEMGVNNQDIVDVEYDSDLQMITISKSSTTTSTKLEKIVKAIVDDYLKEKGI